MRVTEIQLLVYLVHNKSVNVLIFFSRRTYYQFKFLENLHDHDMRAQNLYLMATQFAQRWYLALI